MLTFKEMDKRGQGNTLKEIATINQFHLTVF